MGMSIPASGAVELARAADAVRRYLAVIDAGGLLPADQRADLEDGFEVDPVWWTGWLCGYAVAATVVQVLVLDG